jgi:O-antigen/teichoic acid export membrane protein
MAESVPTPPDSAGPSLTQRTTHGVLWGVILAFVSRGVGLLQQLVLVWLLDKSDFGVVGLALTVTVLINVMANPGIDAVLVQRQRRFHLWATPAFWLGMATGTSAMLVMMAAAPVAAWIYGKPSIIGVLLVMAAAIPLQTLQIVPKAKLQAELRFKTGMFILFWGNVLTAVLTVLCALLGFGAYSFAIPLPISSAIVAALAWRQARPHVRWNPEFRRWKFLFGDSINLGATRIVLNLIGQGDFIVLGLARMPDAAIGVYFFAFNIAVQPFRLIARSIEQVLFPSLNQVGLDPATQIRAMARATRLLALAIVPVCTLQILLAEPLFGLILPARWMEAVVPLQLVSLAVMIITPYWPAYSLMMAQRRFNALFRLSLANAALMFITLGLAIWLNRSIESLAIGVVAWSLLGSPYIYRTALGGASGLLTYFAETYRPFLTSLVASVPCVLLLAALPSGMAADAFALVAVTGIYLLLYILILQAWAASDFQDFLLQVTPLLRKIGWGKIPLTRPAVENESVA